MKNALVISLRAEYVREIFDGKKRVECRKTLPKGFSEGTVYVYECGPNSRHKVVGWFETRCVTFYDLAADSDDMAERLSECLEVADVGDDEREDLKVAAEYGPFWCIPVISPRLYEREMTLAEWSEKNCANPPVTFPPFSWRKTNIKEG